MIYFHWLVGWLVSWLVDVEIDVILRLKDMKCTVLYVDNKISGNYNIFS